MKKIVVYIVMFFCSCNVLWAQTEPEDIAVVEDELENHFYEAIKQRAIENYDKAIVSLELALSNTTDNPALYYELGKNYLDLKRYPEAEIAFKKAVALDETERWYWNGLYDLYYLTKDYEKSIEVLKKLIPFDINMKEDLVSVYFLTKQNQLALNMISEMETMGVLSKKIEYYKLQIIDAQPKTQLSTADLENEIKNNPKVEKNYVDLMLLYATSNEEAKSFEVAKKLATEIPNSDWAQISLFKFYLEKNEGEKAAQALLKVLKNNQIAIQIKHRMFNEFLIYTSNNPTCFKELDKAIALIDSQSDLNITAEVGKFFYTKNYEKAAYYLEKSLKKNPNDSETALIIIQLYSNNNNFEKSSKIAQDYTELYPTLAPFYFYAALSESKLNNSKKAIDFAESGLDFLIENPELERQFYIQLSMDYKIIGDLKKSNSYAAKAQKIK